METTDLHDLLNRRPDSYQSLHVPVYLQGTHNTREIWNKIGLPKRLDDLSFMDIGCSTGSYLAEALHRGARHVTGIDEAPDKCKWASELLNIIYLLDPSSRVTTSSVLTGKYPEVNIGPHSLTIALAVLHHCEYPMQFLASLRQHTRVCAWIEWELWNPDHPSSKFCLRVDKITDDPLPLIPEAPYGRGAYPTENAAIEALNNAGFDSVCLKGHVRSNSTLGNRQVFQCQIT